MVTKTLGCPCSVQHAKVAACFEPVSVYVVIKESDINALSLDVREKQMIIEKDFPYDINAFKLILICASDTIMT